MPRRAAATRSRRVISIIAPVFCEQETLPVFHARLSETLRSLSAKYEFEIIYVNDGSTDRSLDILLDLMKMDARIRVIDLSRNFGHQRAITAGMDAARGDCVVILDSDLQDPPETITEMVRKWEEGYHNVYGVRAERRGESVFKRLSARLFYRLLKLLSDVPIPVDTGDFRLLDRRIVDALQSMREESRYIRGLIAWVGFRQYALSYERDARFAGKTNYRLGRMLTLAVDGITSFSEKPLMLAVQMGLLITGAAFLGILYVVIGRFLHPQSIVAGWPSLLLVILFVGGTQILVSGLLGLYVGRIHRQVKRRPLYVVQDSFGFNRQSRGSTRATP